MTFDEYLRTRRNRLEFRACDMCGVLAWCDYLSHLQGWLCSHECENAKQIEISDAERQYLLALAVSNKTHG